MPASNPHERVVIVAPVGQDATAMADLLNGHGFETAICEKPSDVCQLLEQGEGALLLTEEALDLPNVSELLGKLQKQPVWSELPVIILTRGGESPFMKLLDLMATAAGSVTLLERPLGSGTLLRSVEVALRSRRRQYQVRDLLEAQERKQRELEEAQSLSRRSELQYRTLFNSIDEGFCIVEMIFDEKGRGIDYRFVEINEAFERQTGLSDAKGKRMRELAPGHEQHWFEVYDRVAKTGEASRFQARAEALHRWYDVYAFPVRGDGFGKVAILFNDITPRKLAETALAEAQSQLREHAANLERTVAERTHDLRVTNEQLEAFVYSIAHDLRAPLRSMIGYSQLLVDDYAAGLEETAIHLLRRIQGSSEFMDKLLLDLLAYGRTARSEMALSRVDVRRAWDTALFQCATQIDQTGANIQTIEPLGTVIAHESTLGQSLANLLSNALKFVAPGVPPQVSCRAEFRGHYVRIWVEDNGIGIPVRHHERVFRVFERLNGADYVGTGIGLSIVRKGIERMGGRVGLESDSGEGSKFWIELPKGD